MFAAEVFRSEGSEKVLHSFPGFLTPSEYVNKFNLFWSRISCLCSARNARPEHSKLVDKLRLAGRVGIEGVCGEGV